MTMHTAFPPPGARPSPAAIGAAGIVPLSASRSAIFFDSGRPAQPARRRVTATLDGRPLEGPVAATRLGLGAGGERHVLLMPHPAEGLCRRALAFFEGETLLAATDPLALQSPLSDPAALLAGIDGPGSLRLLKLLLTTGASLLDKGRIGAFGALVDQLAERLGTRLPLAARSPVGAGASVLSWRVPADLDLPDLGELTLLWEGRTRRMTGIAAAREDTDGGRLLHLFVPHGLPADAELLALGGTLLRLGLSGSVAPRPLAAWLGRRSAETRADALAFVERLAAGRQDVAPLAAELACPAGAEPAIRALHLSQTAAGLLHVIAVDDPRGLLAAVRLRMGAAHLDIPCDRLDWHERHGAVAVGLARTLRPWSGAVSLAPLYRSGRTGVAAEAAILPDADLVPAAFRGLPVDTAAAILARTLPATMAARPAWRHRTAEFGRLPAAPSAAVLIAAGPAPEHLHAAVARIVGEARRGSVEIVLHHADGAATEPVRAAAEALCAIHRVGLRVVSVPAVALPSESLRAALRATRAPKIVATGPGVLPARPGWLGSWRRRVGAGAPPRVVAGGTGGPEDAPEGAYAIALNSAARSRLLSSRPRLPGVLADLGATPGLAVARCDGRAFAAHSDAVPDPLRAAVEARAGRDAIEAPIGRDALQARIGRDATETRHV